MSTVSSTARTSLQRLALSLLLLPLLAQAQQAQQRQTQAEWPGAATAAPAWPSPSLPETGRSRAEVIAELVCARASGELEALVLRSYGLPTPPLRMEACAAEPKAAPQPTAVQTAD